MEDPRPVPGRLAGPVLAVVGGEGEASRGGEGGSWVGGKVFGAEFRRAEVVDAWREPAEEGALGRRVRG